MEEVTTKPTKQVFKPNPNRNYRQDLSDIRMRFNALVDQMVEMDPLNQDWKQSALETAQKLIPLIQNLCKEHLGSGEKEEEKQELRLEDLKLTVEKIKDCREEGFIGGPKTHVAIKDSNSFLIGTSRRGLLLFNDGTEVYSGERHRAGDLHHIIYAPHLKCYLLAFNKKLYRKNIDNRPPYALMDVDFGWDYIVRLRYSNLHQRLIINKDNQNISIINPKMKKIEAVMRKDVGDRITDFRLFGGNEDRVVSLTWDGQVLLYSLTGGQRRGVIHSSEIELIGERDEMCVSLAVCEKNPYVLVEIGTGDEGISSRMIIIKVVGDTLINTALIDQFHQEIGFKYALECCGYAGSLILWIGLSNEKNGPAQLYKFDTETEELSEFQGKGVWQQEDFPFSLHPLNGKYYYTGWKGKLMC